MSLNRIRTFVAIRLSVIAVVVAGLGLVIAANAQSNPRPAPASKVVPSRPGNGAGLPNADNGGILANASNGIVSPFVIGWNYVHIQNCTTYVTNSAFYLYAYAAEGPYFYTAQSEFKDLLMPACQSGNWVGFYVIDTAGDWNQVWTYTYR
jgi:hypothetical protein